MKQSGRNKGVMRGLCNEGTCTDLRDSSDSWGVGEVFQVNLR